MRWLETIILVVALSLLLGPSCGSFAADAPAPASGGSLFPELPKTQVSIPWTELRGLLDRGAGEKAAPPTDFVFSQATCDVAISGDRATVTFTAQVNSLAAKWTLVPLGPSRLAVVTVKADDKACPLMTRNNTLYAMFSKAGNHKLEVVAEESIVETPQGRRLTTSLIPSPLVSLTATLPGENLAIESPDAAAAKTSAKGKSTVFSGTYRGASTITITWKPRPAKARPPRIYADTQTLAVVGDGLIRTAAHVELEIVQSPTSELRLKIDSKAIVLNVAGKNVARWSQEKADDGGMLAVTLTTPTLGTQTLDVTYELEFPEDGGDVAIRAIGLEGARRDQGVLAVAGTGVMDIQPGAANVPRIGVSQLPTQIRKSTQQLQLAYRYTKPPAEVTVKLARPKPQAPKRFATTNTLVSIDQGKLICQAMIRYEILHAGVDTMRIGLPAGVELRSVSGAWIRSKMVITEDGQRILVLDPKDLLSGECDLKLVYALRLKAGADAAKVPLVTHPDAETDRGFIGLQVRANYEVDTTPTGLERVDVKELPSAIWTAADSPLLFGYRYAAPKLELALKLTRHEDLSVLVAMSDVCEASTVITPDGKQITKMMYIVRNNMKPFMTLKLPEGAAVWSTLVDDRPVTPARNAKGEVLIPLRKSEEVEEDDEKSYRARRERRRSERFGEEDIAYDQAERLKEAYDDAPKDLKPYDVEIVFVSKPVELEEQGKVAVELPQSDIPTGHLAWAVFLPKYLRVVDTLGNLQEVQSFTLPFRHFGDEEYLKRLKAQEMAKEQAAEAMQAAQEELAEAMDMAQAAKAEGVLPVRIEIPITGEIHRFEKFLVVDQAPEMMLMYRRRLR